MSSRISTATQIIQESADLAKVSIRYPRYGVPLLLHIRNTLGSEANPQNTMFAKIASTARNGVESTDRLQLLTSRRPVLAGDADV